MVGKLGKKQQRYKRAECFFFFLRGLKRGKIRIRARGALKDRDKKGFKNLHKEDVLQVG